MAKLVLVIPCYNEAERLPVDVLGDFLSTHAELAVLLVNDGSSDGTRDVLEAMRERRPDQVGVLNLERNSGKAEAVRLGMLKAMDEGATYAGYWDADMATPLRVAPQFVEIMEARPEIQMVFGSRIQLLGHQIQRELIRHYLGRIFATTVSLMLGLRVYDTQCGAKVFRVTPVTRTLFESPFSSKWIFDVELIARYLHASRQAALDPLEGMYEQPLPEWRDVGGSKVKSGDFVSAFFDLIRIYRRYRPRG